MTIESLTTGLAGVTDHHHLWRMATLLLVWSLTAHITRVFERGSTLGILAVLLVINWPLAILAALGAKTIGVVKVTSDDRVIFGRTDQMIVSFVLLNVYCAFSPAAWCMCVGLLLAAILLLRLLGWSLYRRLGQASI